MPRSVTLVKATVAVAVILLLGFAVDWRNSVAHLLAAAPVWLALAVTANLAALLLSAWRWERLLQVLDPRLGFWPALKAYWVGSLFGNVLPSTVGGDVVRLALVRERAGLTNASASIAVERLTGLVMLLVAALVALVPPAAAAMLGQQRWWLLFSLAGVVAAGILLLVFAPQRLAAGKRGWPRRHLARFPQVIKLLNVAGAFARALLTYRRRPGALVVTLALSAFFYAMLAVFQWALLRAVGADIGLLEVSVAVPLVVLVNLLPISINGLGVTEGAFVLLYSRLGVPPEIALSAAILRRLVILAITSIGLVYWHRPDAAPLRPH
jgi:glycosyltransferase 2 family protein